MPHKPNNILSFLYRSSHIHAEDRRVRDGNRAKKTKILRTAVDKTAARSIFIYLRYDPIIDKRSYTALRRDISYITRYADKIRDIHPSYRPQYSFGKAAESLNPRQSR